MVSNILSKSLYGFKNGTMAPTVLVIFGATGDLARRKIFPALTVLLEKKILPADFKIVAFGRRPFDDEEFRRFVEEGLSVLSGPNEASRADLQRRLSYHQGLFTDALSYKRLAQKLGDIDEFEFKKCSNKLFYLAVPPEHYEMIGNHLAQSGLTIPCSDGTGWTRVLLEKPFGRDYRSARKLDRLLGKLFREEQIFRIDHYLAKETVQNILTFRFENSIFEPLWNDKHITSVEIDLLESGIVGSRGLLYDGLGTLRDVGQNHLLTMLSVIAAERPREFKGEALRSARSAVLRKLQPVRIKELPRFVRRGQYDGYIKENGVAPNSQTETFFRLKAFIGNKRWRGVPFILTSGKALAHSKAEIRICFKDGAYKSSGPNLLSFRVQPEE